MQIKLLDSWLREYLKTEAGSRDIATNLSLTSASVEKIEKYKADDYLYDIEITTNRPDLMSVVGLARELSAILPEQGIQAKFIAPQVKSLLTQNDNKTTIEIDNNRNLVNRICAVVMEVKMDKSPTKIEERLEASGIRSLNNLVDVTNYIMRQLGHPAHVFDYDRLNTKKLLIRESKRGEKIVTLDNREYTLPGGDIVADNGQGEIVDLLGIMGTKNSVAGDNTKRVLLFINNNKKQYIRKTSMELAIRSEAAILNEKGIDPELCYETLLAGIELYKEIASGTVISSIIDIYPNKAKTKSLAIDNVNVGNTLGIDMPIKKSAEILEKLGFKIKILGNKIETVIPSFRNDDIEIEEDLIEEIARVFGYHNLPSKLPQIVIDTPFNLGSDKFFWEKRIKEAFKYWGFTETYTYSMVSENLLEGAPEDAVEIQNPLDLEHVYMRKTLVPSLLEVIEKNPSRGKIKIFEIANVYIKRNGDLPSEKLKIAAVIKQENVSFLKAKGFIEQLFIDLGIKNLIFKKKESGGAGADIYIEKKKIGEIEKLDREIIDFELDFDTIFENATISKNYTPVSKFPPIVEDVRITINPEISYLEIVALIQKQSKLIKKAELIDIYENKKTFRIVYQSDDQNLTSSDVVPIRDRIINSLEKKFSATVDKFE